MTRAQTPYRGRFAPSPTGPLHDGSLLAAVGSWLMARHAGGEWLVRIEDLDPPREVPGAAPMQLHTLEMLGLRSDGPVLYQSTRDARYRAAVSTLLAQGDAFVCHCSRAMLAGDAGIHRRCVPGAQRDDPAIRLRVADGETVEWEDAILGTMRQDVAAEVGDFVLRRTDGLWAYQLAVVVDDADQGINDVVRGSDLLDSTARQILLQRRLGLRVPRHAHLPLVLDAQGRKLSKSEAAPAADAAPMDAWRQAWHALGQPPAALDEAPDVPALLVAAIAAFDPARIPRTPVRSGIATHNAPAIIRD